MQKINETHEGASVFKDCFFAEAKKANRRLKTARRDISEKTGRLKP
jgi:hypothetical protein